MGTFTIINNKNIVIHNVSTHCQWFSTIFGSCNDVIELKTPIVPLRGFATINAQWFPPMLIGIKMVEYSKKLFYKNTRDLSKFTPVCLTFRAMSFMSSVNACFVDM